MTDAPRTAPRPSERPTDRRPRRAGARRALGLLGALTALAGCNGQLDHLGREPTFSPVAETREPIDPSLPSAPTAFPIQTSGIGGPQPVALARAHAASYGRIPRGETPASLWNSGPNSLFGDRRARTIGDILTILIDINDEAELNNTTTRNRTGSDSVTVPNLYGLERLADTILPGANALNPAVTAETAAATTGTGQVAREEEISLRIAATVVDVLPNGHLVITGSQEVRVNFELRDLQIAGIIRPEDITRQNTVTLDKVANARVAYGGRGIINDLQQPRIGRQMVDMLSPF